MRVTEPGLYPDLEADSYFEDPTPAPSLRQSLIPALLDQSPNHAAFLHPRLNPYGAARESTKAQFFGSAVHRLALGKGREISIIKYPDYKSATARERRDEAIRNRRIPVLERDHIQARDMAALLVEALAEAAEGHPYETEVPIFWREKTPAGAVWCAGMLDVWVPALGLIIDPKTTFRPATADAFGREAAANGYDVQAAYYRRGVGRIFPELEGRVRFANLPIEKTPPHGWQLLEPDEPTAYLAGRRIDQAVDLWGRCLAARSWPSYPRKIGSYSTPAYHQRAQLEAEEAESYAGQ